MPPKHILYDIPVSNNGARCRIILYKKKVPESEVAMVPPSDIGGLKSADYLRLNPEGKMPLLVCKDEDLSLPESDTIARYLVAKFPDGPSFQLDNPASNLIARLHDCYISPIQASMYKMPPFSSFGTRADGLHELQRQLGIIEGLIDPTKGEFLCGNEVSLADATLFPTAIFFEYILPKYDISPSLPPKIQGWFDGLKKDADFAKIYQEVKGGLSEWDSNKRWDTILGAGVRDIEPTTIFDKIIAGEIPSSIVLQTEKVLAFKDINPAAPAHVIVIPKKRNNLARLTKASVEHKEILGELMYTASKIARDESLGFGDGARFVVNDGPDGGQEVMHLHVHVLGGRSMAWPPG